MHDRPGPDVDVQMVLGAVAAARSRGDVRVQARTLEIGGQSLTGQPFKTVVLDDPPAVHFPDARSHRSASGTLMTVLFVVAAIAVILAIVSIAVDDWLFFAIFAALAVICGGAGWRVDRATAEPPDAVAPGYDGVTLLPDALIVADRGSTQLVPRHEVVEFGARNFSHATASTAKMKEYVDVLHGVSTQRIVLQPWIDADQRAACEAWRAGAWPPLEA